MEFPELQLTDVQQARLDSATNTYMRDVRDYFNTKSVLIRRQELGGIGLSEEQAIRILSKLEAEKKNKHGEQFDLTGSKISWGSL